MRRIDAQAWGLGAFVVAIMVASFAHECARVAEAGRPQRSRREPIGGATIVNADAETYPDADPPDTGDAGYDAGYDAGIWPDAAADSGLASTESMIGDGVDDADDQYVTIADNAALTLGAAMTSAAWVREQTQTNGRTLFGKWGSAAVKEWAVQMDSNTDEYRVLVGTSASNFCRTTAANAVTTAYQHVCFQYDGTGATNEDKIRIWINGTEQTGGNKSCSGTVPTSMSDTAANVTLFSGNGGITPAHTYLDSVTLFSNLTSCVTLYNSGVPRDVMGFAGLVGWWRMGEGRSWPTIPNAANPGTYDGTATNMVEGTAVTNVVP